MGLSLDDVRRVPVKLSSWRSLSFSEHSCQDSTPTTSSHHSKSSRRGLDEDDDDSESIPVPSTEHLCWSNIHFWDTGDIFTDGLSQTSQTSSSTPFAGLGSNPRGHSSSRCHFIYFIGAYTDPQEAAPKYDECSLFRAPLLHYCPR